MEVYFVFMNFDPVYERLQGNSRSKKGKEVLDAYLNSKHDKLLAELLQPNTYRKRSSLAIVDGFAVEITREQVHMHSLMYRTEFNVLLLEISRAAVILTIRNMARIVLILAVIHSLFILSHARNSIEPHGESISSIKTLSSNETNSTLLDAKESDGVELINLTWEEGTTDSAVIDRDRHGDEGPPLDEIPISPGEARAWVSKVEEEGEGKEQMEEKNKKVEDSDSDTDSDDDSEDSDSDSDSDTDSDDEEDDEEDYKKKEMEKKKKDGKGGFVKWFLNLVNRF